MNVTATTNTTDLSRFCSVCARQAGLDPIGFAHSYRHVLAAEIPLPWPESMYSEPGVLPQELLNLRQLLIAAYERGESLHIGSLAIAPDPAYSVKGYRRVISYRRPDELFARFEQDEYLVPEGDIGPLCWALLVAHDQLPRFDTYRQPSSNIRDLLVCTHGAVDAACAKFGFPIYRQLRKLADESNGQLRVWRVSHFGAHIFAPTLIDMPEFRYWGYVEREEAPMIVNRNSSVVRLRNHYRGWAGLEHELLQVAERELFVRFGWPWIDYLKAGRILAQADSTDADNHGDKPTWAEVQIDYAAADGSENGTYVARVERTSTIECKYSTADAETYAYPQYAVTRLEQIA
jgi:hypothetical protein